MDDKPLHFPTFPKREPSSSDQKNDSGSDTEERPKKRIRRIVDSSTTCAPEQLHCRYANKKCMNPRAVKRTGGLHTFCAMHRANANRNQRRLDMRKRMARQALRGQTEGQIDAKIMQQEKIEEFETTASPTNDYAQYEPLHSPTPLQEEDISTLVTLFLPPQNTHEFQLDGANTGTPTTPTDWSSSTSTGGRTPPPSGGMRL
ncbi:hypothetical protein PHMEG_00031996 [Phytophthora megakarya]|uniref:Uncharacterized protein n=1 Tax=Phytophthora megakarya TaxID=4795 RepID=A0A225UWZ6_9STRA|nr:hypothetical protein PHMEG_00031996 [Phytophthora megakarya]